MEKREDCWWRESTLGEDVDVKVGTYLRANHQEYQEIRHQIDELIQQYPAVREYSCAAEPPVRFDQSHHSRSESHQKCYAAKGSLYE